MVGKIYPGDVEAFASFDTTLVWDKFPKHIHVLTIHGLKDAAVPPCVVQNFSCTQLMIMQVRCFYICPSARLTGTRHPCATYY